jgi:adenylate kinase
VRCSTDLLFQRLEQRGYNATKTQNNVEYEIFQMAADEARSSYDPSIVQEVRGETEENLEKGLQMVGDFLNEL